MSMWKLKISSLVLGVVIILSMSSSSKTYIFIENERRYEDLIERILALSNSYVKFDVRAASDIKNCRTICDSGIPVLVYNPVFLSEYEEDGFGFTESRIINWVGLGILAHEAGHIALSHCTKHRAGSKQAEIEADMFMGKALHMLGASLKQAQSCLYIDDVSVEGNYIYPSQKERLENVKRGWESIVVTSNKGEDELVLARRYYLVGGKRNYKKSFELFSKNSKQDFFTDTDMYMLGVMHLKGRGTKKNFKKAVFFLEKSYLRGNQKAYHLYRLLYY